MILLSTDSPVLLVVVEVYPVDTEATEKLSPVLGLVAAGRSIFPVCCLCCFSSSICFRTESLTVSSVTGPPFLVVTGGHLAGIREVVIELSEDSEPTMEGGAGRQRGGAAGGC